MRGVWRLLLALLAGFLAAGPLQAALFEQEISFSEAQVQSALEKSGPQEKNYGGWLTVSMHEAPRVALGQPAGQIGIVARLYVTLLGQRPIPVDVTGSSGIRYDDQAKAFFLDKPLAQRVDAPNLPREAEPGVRQTVNALIASYFRNKPIYTLRENASLQETAARWLLRSVRIEPGRIVAILAPN